jgi:hypothetical protein
MKVAVHHSGIRPYRAWCFLKLGLSLVTASRERSGAESPRGIIMKNPSDIRSQAKVPGVFRSLRSLKACPERSRRMTSKRKSYGHEKLTEQGPRYAGPLNRYPKSKDRRLRA